MKSIGLVFAIFLSLPAKAESNSIRIRISNSVATVTQMTNILSEIAEVMIHDGPKGTCQVITKIEQFYPEEAPYAAGAELSISVKKSGRINCSALTKRRIVELDQMDHVEVVQD